MGLRPFEMEDLTAAEFIKLADSWIERQKRELELLRQLAAWILLPHSQADKQGRVVEPIKPRDICVFSWEQTIGKLFKQMSEDEREERRKDFEERIHKWGVKQNIDKVKRIKNLGL